MSRKPLKIACLRSVIKWLLAKKLRKVSLCPLHINVSLRHVDSLQSGTTGRRCHMEAFGKPLKAVVMSITVDE